MQGVSTDLSVAEAFIHHFPVKGRVMSNEIRAVMFGLGMTGRSIAQCMLDRGIRIVGVITASEYHGHDLGEVLGRARLGVSVEADGEAMLRRVSADIAVVATQNGIGEIYPIVRMCLENGTNVITIAGDAYFPWVSPDRALSKELHELAIAKGKTILATGIEEVFWDTLPMLLSGAAQSVTGIHGTSCSLVDHFGDWVKQALYLGALPEDLPQDIVSPFGHVFDPPLHSIANKLGLAVTEISRSVEPVVARKDVDLPAADIQVKAGQVVGLTAITVLESAEGVVLSAQFMSKLQEEHDSSFMEWKIAGKPNLSVFVKDRHDLEATSATVVNRIPDVIKATPGFVTTAELPPLRYLSQTIGSYV